MIAAGRCDKLVTLENPGAAIPDGAGGFTETWAPLSPPTMWVHLDALTSGDMERMTSDTIVAMGTHVVSLQYHPQVTVQTRIRYEARTFQVVGLRDPDEAHRELILVAAEAL